MPKLILIRHSESAPLEGIPPHEWQLSPEGQRLCLPLAEQLRSYQLARLISSTEPKASETARLVAEQLHLPFATALGLHEHKRSNVSWVSPEIHQTNLADLFARPGELVMGDETAEQAGTRFIQAIDQVLEPYPDETLAIVSHATVIALFVAYFNPTIHPFDYWCQLQMPDIIVLERSTRRLLHLPRTVQAIASFRHL